MTLRQGIQRITPDGVEWWQHTMNRMVRCRTVTDLLDLAYDAVRGGLGYDRVSLVIDDPARGIPVERIATDPTGRKVYPVCDHAPALDCLRGDVLVDERLSADGPGFVLSPLVALDRAEIGPALYVALRTSGRVLGYLAVANLPDKEAVKAGDAPPLVALGSAIATAIENAVLLEERARLENVANAELRQRIAELELALEHERDERARLRTAHGSDWLAQLQLDSLTGLLNHRALLEHIDRAIDAGDPFAMLLLDVDNFKLFNDTHGHMTGDGVLSAVAAVVREVCAEDKVLGRYGGDEFVVLLSGATGSKARTVLRRLESTVRARPHVTADGAIVPLTISTGLACYPNDGQRRQDLVAIAKNDLATGKRSSSVSRSARLRQRCADLIADSDVGVLNGLVTAVDVKDRYTREHSDDVTRWALLLAEAIGLDAEDRRVLALAAPLHDVGKIAVPDRILRKPGRLTRDEYEIMKHHVAFGVAILQGILHDDAVINAVAHHHERWDGKGYPCGLSGHEAAMTGRIMQIADALSAMRLNRPYRQALPWATVIVELRMGAGTQFDPVLVEPLIGAVGHLRS